MPELGPVKGRRNAVTRRDTDVYSSFDDLDCRAWHQRCRYGSAPRGRLGTFRPGEDPQLTGLALTIDVAVPSSRSLQRLLPPEVPEFGRLQARFRSDGHATELLSLGGLEVTGEGPEGLVFSLEGGIDEIRLAPPAGASGLRSGYHRTLAR